MTTLTPIRISGETAATVDAAWAALTEPEQVARWFAETSPVEGGAGEAYSIDFGEGGVIDGVIRELVPGRRLSYTWQWRGQEEAPTLVTWELEPLVGHGCRITLTHEGWQEAGADEALRDDHAGYWEGYLADLLDMLAADAAGGRGGSSGQAVF
jgi:uncharacterized protein YndB with AHSA1/START domain